MELGANPNDTGRRNRYGTILHSMAYQNMDLSYIKQVLEIILNEKKKKNNEEYGYAYGYSHVQSFDWDRLINRQIAHTDRDSWSDNIVIICIRNNNLELLEYLCLKSKNYNTPIDMNNKGERKTPLLHILQPTTTRYRFGGDTNGIKYYDFENDEKEKEKEKEKGKKESNSNSKRRLQFADLLMRHNQRCSR